MGLIKNGLVFPFIPSQKKASSLETALPTSLTPSFVPTNLAFIESLLLIILKKIVHAYRNHNFAAF